LTLEEKNDLFLELYEKQLDAKEMDESALQLLILFDEMLLKISSQDDIMQCVNKLDEHLKNRKLTEKRRKLLSTIREDLLNKNSTFEEKNSLLIFFREKMEENYENAKKMLEKAEKEFASFCKVNKITDTEQYLDSIKIETSNEDLIFNLSVMQEGIINDVSNLLDAAFGNIEEKTEKKEETAVSKPQKNTPKKPVVIENDDNDDMDEFYSGI